MRRRFFPLALHDPLPPSIDKNATRLSNTNMAKHCKRLTIRSTSSNDKKVPLVYGKNDEKAYVKEYATRLNASFNTPHTYVSDPLHTLKGAHLVSVPPAPPFAPLCYALNIANLIGQGAT